MLTIKTDSKEFEDLVNETKFVNYKDYHKKNEGYILIQDHGSEVYYRNILIREL